MKSSGFISVFLFGMVRSLNLYKLKVYFYVIVLYISLLLYCELVFSIFPLLFNFGTCCVEVLVKALYLDSIFYE
jgi:hypothetical protein